MNTNPGNKTLRSSVKLPFSVLILAIALQGCGGGGGGAAPAPPVAAPPPVVVPPTVPEVQTKPDYPVPPGLWQADTKLLPTSGNYIYLKSEAGTPVPDFIGASESYLYSESNLDQIYVTLVEGRVNVLIVGPKGAQLWSGDFEGMGKMKSLQPGLYSNAHRYPFQTLSESGMAVGNGILSRGCNRLNGWFAIDKIEYADNKPAVLDLRFEQHCEGHEPALHCQIHWVFDTTPRPLPGPVEPPAALWRADAGGLPVSGNYAYLKSDVGEYAGDFYGNAATDLFTSQNAQFLVSASAGRLSFNIKGDKYWVGEFQTRDGVGRIQPGYYGDLGGYFDPERGQLRWSGPGGSGGARTGGAHQSWLVVDSVTYVGDTLTAIDLRFAQHGGGLRAALRGQVRWSASDTSLPPGPLNPPPASLWRPDAGATPALGNFLYLQSDPGDYIGAGKDYLYTPENSTFWIRNLQGNMLGDIEIRVFDQDLWLGMFRGLSGMAQLEPGHYVGVLGLARNNPTKGGFDWGGHGRGCNANSGWFAVDHIVYTAGELTALDLRFEQHCEHAAAALRGALRWIK